ncbi:hypothetical protein Slin15195_G028180 [Septoria linicola]|uniref:C-x8-C-x5-C-x3-H type zinc finger protein n=1 Tax=Septoria linicola TaxID=215465 RepID=A0A9Q9EH12_9PEZI|nr:hypothetical protein Slin14017_G027230 [Septoria linicola]USW49499.1 hypothetical protein Slin15195_G028180 [Septoria linicola]
MDPIGTPRRYGSLTGNNHNLLRDTSNGWNSLNGSRTSSAAATPVRTPVREVASVASSSNAHLSDLWSRYDFSKSQYNVQNKLLEEVLHRYSSLVLDHEELQRTTAQGKPDARAQQTLEGKLQMLTAERDMLKSLLLSNPFIMVLIDGDGMIFNNELLQLGEHGGRKAARQLKQSIFQMLADHPHCPEDSQIIVKVYANVNGLGRTLVSAGILSSQSIFDDFVVGFTRGDETCDLIDVGPGKDLADTKLNANFRQFFYDHQCRQIVFGCSHDNGYARLLENYMGDDQDTGRVTLLGGVPFEKELAVLPFDKRTIPGLFRDTKISLAFDLLSGNPRSRHDSKNVFNPASAMFTPPPSTRTPAPSTPMYSPATLSFRDNSTRANSITSSVAVSEPAVVAGAPGPAPASVPTPVPSSAGGWANIARRNAHLPFKDIAKPQVEDAYTGPVVLVNKNDFRIDKDMDYDHDKVYKLKQAKYCNQHYIGRGCCHYRAANGACPHEHNTKLSEDDKKWLRVVARETVCKKGTSCREFDCIYGHHCPYPKQLEGSLRGIGCINGDKCRFAPEMHGMDRKVHKILTPKDIEELEEEQ